MKIASNYVFLLDTLTELLQNTEKFAKKKKNHALEEKNDKCECELGIFKAKNLQSHVGYASQVRKSLPTM